MKYFCGLLVAFFLSFSSYAISPITGSGSICTGSTDTLLDATPGGSWTSSSLLIATVGSSSGVVTGVYPGTAIITYTASGVRTTTTVTVNPVSPITGGTTICSGNSTVISDGIFGGTWSISNTTHGSIVPSVTYATFTGSLTGKDTAIYTLPTGCKVSAVININPLPAPITGPGVVCVGQVITLSDASGSGSWSSSLPAIANVGLLSGAVIGEAAGPVNISYTLPTGCFITTAVTVNPLPAAIAGVTHVYQGLSTTLSDPTPGGVWSSLYPSIATVGSVTGTVTGVSAEVDYINYTLTSTGCTINTQFLVNPFPDSAASFPVIGWYPFCGNLKDHSTSGHDLLPGTVPLASPTLTTDRFGNTNTAYFFNGTSSAARYSTVFPTNGDFTISCWVCYDTDAAHYQSAIILFDGLFTTNGVGFIISDGTPALGAGNQVGVYLGGLNLYLNENIQANPLYNSTATLDPTSPPLAPRYWYNLMLVRAGSLYSFYVNDIPAGVFTPLVSMSPPTGNFQLGVNFTGGTRKYMGYLDDVAFYSTSLTDEQRTELYMFNPDPKSFNLGPDKTICSDTVYLSPNVQNIGYTYQWSTGDSLDTAIIVTPPVLSGTLTSSYSLTISKPYGCSVSDTMLVHKNLLPIHLGVDTNICVGDTITLNATYHSGKYLWITGDTTAKIKVYNTGAYSVTVDSSLCVGRDTIFVTARTTPKVDLGPDIFSCTGSPSTIHNIYQLYDTGMTYLWSNGSNLDTLVTTTSGTYWVQVNNNGCMRADTINSLIIYDTFSFYSHDTAICRGQSVVGKASFNAIISYQWTPTTGVPLSTDPQPVITPDTTAWYYLTGRYPGCPDIVDSFHIDVQPNPIVFAGGNRKVCQYDTLHLSAQVSPNWYSKYIFKWGPGTYLDDPTKQNIIFTAGDTTNLYVTVTTTAGCTGSDSVIVVVYPGSYDSSFADILVCPGDSLNLRPNMYYQDSLAGVVATYQWHPGTYFTDSTATMPWLHAVTSMGFTAIGTSQYGCLDTFKFNVQVVPNAVIFLGDSVVLHPGQSYHIPTKTNCSYFSWFPSVGLNDTSYADPVASPPTSTNYIVHAATDEGCKVVDSISIRVDPSTILAVPNAFTPGAGINASLFIIKLGVATLDHFRIYNRWGNKVFETSNINEGWDGNFNGKAQPFDVYMYQIEATTSAGTKFNMQGNVTLIR